MYFSVSAPNPSKLCLWTSFKKCWRRSRLFPTFICFEYGLCSSLFLLSSLSLLQIFFWSPKFCARPVGGPVISWWSPPSYWKGLDSNYPNKENHILPKRIRVDRTPTFPPTYFLFLFKGTWQRGFYLLLFYAWCHFLGIRSSNVLRGSVEISAYTLYIICACLTNCVVLVRLPQNFAC